MYNITKQIINNQELSIIEIKQDNIEVSFLDYGATLLSIKTPDKEGNLESILLGYKEIETYINNGMFLNATVGPTSGRIEKGVFTINDITYQLDTWKNQFNLHGGEETIAFKIFNYNIEETNTETRVQFHINKPSDGSNYPGNVDIYVTFIVKESELHIEYEGTTDQDTILNLTQHAYFNLSGDLKRDTTNHIIQINASKHIALDGLIPRYVESTLGLPIDFSKPKTLQTYLEEDISGLDHPYLLDAPSLYTPQASLFDPISNRLMEVYTTYPCIVVYSHNHPDGKTLLYNREHKKHLGVCFETQLPPNSMHIEGLGNQILRRGQHYLHKAIFKFSVKH